MVTAVAESPLSDYSSQAVQDLRAPVLRNLLLFAALVAWAGATLSPMPGPRPALALALGVVGLGLACQLLVRRSYNASAALFVVGLAILGVATAYCYPEQPVAYLLSLVVAVAVFLRGPAAGLLLATLVTGVLLVPAQLRPALPRPANAAGGLVLAWLSLGVTWQGTRPLATLVSWSWQSYEEARRRAAELEERQARLAQVLKDLDNAYNELANANYKLAFSKAVADEARRAKAEFVANVSHELRTPINMIMGFTEVILRSPSTYARGGLPPALLADLDVVLRNAQHLSDLINDILDLSQLEVGRMGLVKEWTSIAEIAEQAVAAILPLARTRGLAIELEIEPGLPPVYVDGTRIRQVLLNLLSNAVRFTAEGRIRVAIRRDEEQILASVGDTGPGIAAEDIPKLFEPFRQLDGSLRRRYGGTGLGLHISRSFVVLHGGDISVSSQLGQGTTIHFSLPIEDSVPFAPLQRSPEPERAPDGAGFVVVEQQPLLEGLLRRYLDGGTVVPARDLAQAGRLSRSQASLAIAVRTAHADQAWQVLAEAAHADLHAPLIVCAMPGAIEAYSAELGLADYMLKPVTRQRLLDALARVPAARTILIVDDDHDFLRLFARLLRSARRGYTVWQAASADEALALLANRKPDAIFLDVLMPGMDGPTLVGRIRSQEALRDIPIFFVTACDASGSPLVATVVGISHRGGLSADELMRCLEAVGRTLRGAIPPADRELPAARPG